MNMKQPNCHENYPFWIVLISNLLSIAICAIGAYLISRLGAIWLVLYLLFILVQEIKLLKGHCVSCYYYGKYCAFGKGKLSSLLFKKADPKKFARMQLTWKDLLPDFMVSLIPIIVGVVLLIRAFSWLVLALILILLLLTFIGNGAVRSSLACKYCKQRKLGCPAEKLFDKTKKPGK